MSAGNWNRRSSDKCAYQQEVIESTAPVSYMLYSGKFRNCGLCNAKNECCSEDGLKQEQSTTHGNRVDIESDLKNIRKLSSKCNDLKYKPQKIATVEPLHRNPRPCYNWTSGLQKTNTTGYNLPTRNCTNN